jgi:hypothetical protein
LDSTPKTLGFNLQTTNVDIQPTKLVVSLDQLVVWYLPGSKSSQKMGGTQWREHPKTTEKRLVYSLLRL